MIQTTIDRIVDEFRNCLFICGIALGGSRATETATDQSDIDIGIYYDRDSLDYPALNAIAERLDDKHRKNLICQEGGWGSWVNFGGWLAIDGHAVDLIFRDIARVRGVIERVDRGEFASHYHTGHPHAFIDIMYRGELASCKVLYARDDGFRETARRAKTYPPALKDALLNFFLFESNFSCMLAEKNLHTGDSYYIAGNLFRAVSALNQALFAFNERWCLNEKKAIFRIDAFERRPDRYSERVRAIFEGAPDAAAIQRLKEICGEVAALCGPRS